MSKKTCSIVLLVGLFAFAFGFLLVGCGTPSPTPTPTPTPAPVVRPPIVRPPLPVPTPAAGVVQQLLDGHNQQRTAKGLPPLVINPKLQAAAQGHANFMAQKGQMAHQGIGDGDPFTRIRAQGYTYRAAGENVAWNQQTAQVVMNAWMNSPGHRANILGNYTQAGLAVAYGKKNDPYWCVTFGTPARLTQPAECFPFPGTTRMTTAEPVVSRGANSAASSISTTPEAGR